MMGSRATLIDPMITQQLRYLWDEQAALLGFGSQEDEQDEQNQQQEEEEENRNVPQHELLCPTSAEVIERTNVLFRPDFSRTQDFGLGTRRQNRIAMASIDNTRQWSDEERNLHQIILDETGIAEISTDRSATRLTNARTMIGTITTTSILNLVLVTPLGGIGMIILPGCFAAVGWLEGLVLLVASGLSSAASLFLLDWICVIINAKGRENGHGGHYFDTPYQMDDEDEEVDGILFAVPSEATASYEGVVAYCLGRPGSLVAELFILLHSLGQLVAYIGAICGQISALLSLMDIKHGMNIDTHMWLVALGIIFPLAIISEENSKMRLGGIAGSICTTYIALLVVVTYGFELYRHDGGICSLSPEATHNATSSWVALFRNAPIFLFVTNTSVGYVPVRYQQMSCLSRLLSSMTIWSDCTSAIAKIPHQESSVLIWTSVIMAGNIYAIGIGVAYAAHCDAVPEVLFNDWPINWMPGLLARLLLVVELVVVSAGILLPIGRASLERLLYCGNNQHRRYSVVKYTAATLILIVSGAIGSIRLNGVVLFPLAMTSAVCGTMQVFVLPGLCALALLRQGYTYTANSCIGTTSILGFVIFGGGLGILSLLALLGKIK